jgi:hypothetical protein
VARSNISASSDAEYSYSYSWSNKPAMETALETDYEINSCNRSGARISVYRHADRQAKKEQSWNNLIVSGSRDSVFATMTADGMDCKETGFEL